MKRLIRVILLFGMITLSACSNENKNEGIFAKGKNAIVLEKDVQKATDFYISAGMSEKEAREQAEEYMMQYEAMYYQAIHAGFEVTDDEVRCYINELKNAVETANNRIEIRAVIEQFESEEAYWEYEFEIYKKSLPIQQYVKELEKEYSEKIILNDTSDDWNKEFENIKRDAVQKEKYKVLK